MVVAPGAWELAEMQAAPLPEKVASAFSEITSALVGADYIPVLYCGEQVVHGTNHMIICEQKRVCDHKIMPEDDPKHLVSMIINCSEQGNTLVEINKII